MKYLFLLIMLMFSQVTFSAEAALVIFGGTGNTQSNGGALTAVNGGSGAAIVGVSGTQANANTVTAGRANTTVTPTGVTSSNGDISGSTGNSVSFGFGLAGGASQFGAGSGSNSNAIGNFGSIGLGVFTVP